MDDTAGRIDTGRARAADDEEDDGRAFEIREEIAVTRDEMTETIDAIQERLTPRNIVAQATDRVKSATAERVSEMADTAGRTARQALDYSRQAANSVAGSTRDNAVPIALIGIGAAWLLVNRSRSDSYSYSYGGARRNRYDDDSVRGYRDDDDSSQITSRAQEYVSDTVDSVRTMAARRTNQVQRMMHENPLLVGAGALLLGAAFGLAVPETETENEWMGEARDTVVERARGAAKDAANEVQEAANAVVDVAKQVTGKTQA